MSQTTNLLPLGVSPMAQYLSPIVGAYYRPPAQLILAALKGGTPLLLDPDPYGEVSGTPHDDPNAVMVSIALGELSKISIPDDFLLVFGFTWDNVLSNVEQTAAQSFHLGYLPRQPKESHYVAASAALELMKSPYQSTLTFSPEGKPLVKIEQE